MGAQIDEHGDNKEVVEHNLNHHTDGVLDNPQIQKSANALSDHIQSPEQTERAEGEVFVIDFAEDKARDRKQEKSEEAYQQKQ